MTATLTDELRDYLRAWAIDAATTAGLPMLGAAITAALRTIDAQREEIERLEKLRDWEDVDDEWSAAIDEAHPIRSGAHDRYAIAMKMVGHRHSKANLVSLVSWLLVRIAALEAENAALMSVGTRMSNVCFNLSQLQGELRIRDRDLMRDLAKRWDALRKGGGK